MIRSTIVRTVRTGVCCKTELRMIDSTLYKSMGRKRKSRKPDTKSPMPVLIYVSAGNAPRPEREARMDAKAAWLSSYASDNHCRVLKVVRENRHYRPDNRGLCILDAHWEYPSALTILVDSFDAVAVREWATRHLNVLVIRRQLVPAPALARVVTLVHGTFFPNAEWTQTNSDFSNGLRDNLPGAVVRRFQWSSKNTPSARLQASFELLFYLEEVSCEFPGCEHYIVAHSHGGSVALHCLQNEVLQPYVAGLICMNTPLLEYRLRDHMESSAPFGLLGLLAALVIGVMFGAVAGLLGCGAILVALFSFAPGSKRDAISQISRLATGVPVVPLYWVHNQDQMPHYLRMIATLTALPGWTWMAAEGVLAALVIGASIPLFAHFIVSMIWLIATGNLPHLPWAPQIFRFWEAAFNSSLGLVFIAPFLMFTVVLVGMVRCVAAFGSVGLGDVFISVKTNSEPPGHSQYDRLSVVDSKGFWYSLLHWQHSRLYDNAKVIGRISSWIEIQPKPVNSGNPTSSVMFD